jgi:hypothetical protein
VKTAAVVLVLVAAVWYWQHHKHVANEHALAAVASELTGRDVGIECQGFIAEMVDIKPRSGDVPFPNGRAPDHAYLTRKICRALERFRNASSHSELDCLLTVDWSRWSFETDFRSDCSNRARPATEAINTLAHEAMHLRGFVDEAQTQCYAIQQDAWTVIRLGGTGEQGAALARFVLALQPGLPSEYQSGACVAGGGLDLHPETPAFPTEESPALPPTGLRGPALGA